MIKQFSYNLLSLILFLVMPAAMLSGISSSVFVVILLLCIAILIPKMNISIANLKLEIFLLSVYLIHLFFNFNSDNLFTILLISALIFFTLFIMQTNFNLDINYNILIAGAITAIAIFSFQYYFDGFLVEKFWNILPPSKPKIFKLYMLDRGCNLLALASWIVIAILLRANHQIIALFYYIILLSLLAISDSLATFVAFSLSGLLFVFARFISMYFLKVVKFTIILGAILLPILFYNIHPNSFIENYASKIPLSAKHRIFIYHWMSEGIAKQPILGYGINAFRYIDIHKTKGIWYDGVNFEQPTHPHNNILQILFETGALGFIAFLLLIYKYCSKLEVRLLELNKVDNEDSITMIEQNLYICSYCCFLTYFIIGMISFNMWQTSWVSNGLWCMILFKIYRQEVISNIS
ncbi:MAG: O-antigen ligase family protein [Rickettsiaceae bacterium]